MTARKRPLVIAQTGCKICDAPHNIRIRLDTIFIRDQQNAQSDREIHADLMVALNELDPLFILSVDDVERHANHVKAGDLPAMDGVSTSSGIQLPNGEIIASSNVKQVLTFMVTLGIRNMAENPGDITAKDVLRALEMMVQLQGGGGEAESLMAMILEKLKKPDSSGVGPYAPPAEGK